MRAPAAAVLALVLLARLPLHAQDAPVAVVVVRDLESGAPIAGAGVRTLVGRASRTADQAGRLRLAVAAGGDTIVAFAIGYRPDTLAMTGETPLLEVRLRRLPLSLADLTAVSLMSATPVAVAPGAWQLPQEALRLVPPAVEADPFRALAIVPSVAFSSVLSARPLVRGYDAAESRVALDGHELVNPYHVGRVFSSVPMAAVRQVNVATSPRDLSIGGTVAGDVDIAGLGGRDLPRGASGGGDVTLLSASAWAGATGPVPVLGVGRLVYSAVLDELADLRSPYDFRDVYLKASPPGALGSRAEAMLYLSDDDLLDRDLGSGLDRSLFLVGGRGRVFESARTTLELSLSHNESDLAADGLQLRGAELEVRNAISRTSLQADATHRLGAVTVTWGAGASRRRMSGGATVVAGENRLPAADSVSLTDVLLYGGAGWGAGRWRVELGTRLDANRDVTLLQPRAQLRWRAGDALGVGLVISHGARTWQQITDPAAEPDLVFYDFWRTAGRDGVPVPRATHLSVEAESRAGAWSLFAAGYLSRGSGLGELRPPTDQGASQSPIRYGDSRTGGLELRAAWLGPAAAPASLALSYALAWSERRWSGEAWVPWRLDRRHTIRLAAQSNPERRVRLQAFAEFASGVPVTPVAGLAYIDRPPAGIAPSPVTPLDIRYIYGAEGSVRSGATVRADAAAAIALGGPFGSRMDLTISVTNLVFGPVAPELPMPAQEYGARAFLGEEVGAVPYQRSFSVPAVPSVGLRVRF